MKPIFRRNASSSFSSIAETFWPSTSTPPLSGRNNPAAIFNVSVFPVPVSPSKTTVSRSRTQNDTPRRISPSSKPMRTFSKTIADLASPKGKDPSPIILAIIAAIGLWFPEREPNVQSFPQGVNKRDGRTIQPLLKQRGDIGENDFRLV